MLKEHHTDSTVKIGIVGPRCYCLDGHDIHNDTRVALRLWMSNILNSLKTQFDVMGYTGLLLGSDQDFALSCIECDIKFTVVTPYESPEKYWIDTESNVKLYHSLLDQSYNNILLNKGKYSPKKIINKHKFIITHCDIIIFIQSLYYNPQKFMDMSIRQGKGLIHYKL